MHWFLGNHISLREWCLYGHVYFPAELFSLHMCVEGRSQAQLYFLRNNSPYFWSLRLLLGPKICWLGQGYWTAPDILTTSHPQGWNYMGVPLLPAFLEKNIKQYILIPLPLLQLFLYPSHHCPSTYPQLPKFSHLFPLTL